MLPLPRARTLVALALLAAPPLLAQRAVPGTYAITNARIVPVAGPVIDKGTIVIRDGLIAAVGASVAVPADARVVDGAGHTVYPGLIDAYSSLGMRAAPAGPGGGFGGFGAPAPSRPAGAPNSSMPVGMQPEVRAIDQLVDGTDYSAAWNAGITTALTAPQGRVYEGQSALISLSGAGFGTATVRPAVALHVGFQGIGGGQFPSSLMGVFAALRQSLLDAQHYALRKAAYDRNPRASRRPDYDPSLEALLPVVAGTMPVVFRVNAQREIERALDLAKEFKLKAYIGGGSEAHLVADRLKAENVPVLLSINFPRKAAPTGPAADVEPEPLRVLRERVQAPKTPAQLKAAGVRFAVQAGGNYTDFVANLRRMVAGGLPADDAIRATTLGSAELLGAADRLGSIEVGKIADLTVVRGSDLFAADSRVTEVWVDGRPHAATAPVAARGPGAGAGPGPQRPGLEGLWQLQIMLEGSEHVATLVLRDQDGQLRGQLEGDLGAQDVLNLQIDEAGEIAFSAIVTTKEGTEEGWFRGRLNDGVFSGTLAITGHAGGRFAALRHTSDEARERQERE
jgi:imidazolonepropionase-like amidohydrolase